MHFKISYVKWRAFCVCLNVKRVRTHCQTVCELVDSSFHHGVGQVIEQLQGNTLDINHDDVIKWKHFPHYWPFVRGIHRSPVNSPQRPVTRSFDVSFDLRLNKRLSKQPWCWWFETPTRSLWRHCNAPRCLCTGSFIRIFPGYFTGTGASIQSEE